MPAELSAADVLDWAQTLDNDTEGQRYREKFRIREQLHSMRLPPELTERLREAGDVAELNDATLAFLVQIKRSKWLTYDTHVSCYNLEDQSPQGKRKADELEKRAVMALAQLNDGHRWDMDTYWHTLITGYSVAILHCGEDDLDDPYAFPLWIENPDPKTCFFPMGAGPMRPAVLARRYTMTVGDAEKMYSGRMRGVLGGQQLRFRASDKTWLVFGDDMEAAAAGLGLAEGKRGMEQVEFVWLADGQHVYHIARAGQDKQSQIVFCSPEVTGGVPAVVVPGVVSPIRDAAERMLPLYWPIEHVVEGLNETRSRRATMSDRITNPTPAIERNPAQAQAQAQPIGEGGESVVSTNRPFTADPGQYVMTVDGRIAQLPGQLNPDLDKLEESLKGDLQLYRQAHMNIDRPEDYSRSTANVQLQQIKARNEADAETLGHVDWGRQQILAMALQALASYNRPFSLVTTKAVRYGRGKVVSEYQPLDITPADMDFKYRINVETEAVTDQERRLKTEIVWEDYAVREISTFAEVIESKYDDASAQWEALAIDARLRYAEGPLGTFSEARLNGICSEILQLESGISVQAGVPQLPPGAAGPGAAPPGAAPSSVPGTPPQPMQAPVVPAAMVGGATGG